MAIVAAKASKITTACISRVVRSSRVRSVVSVELGDIDCMEEDELAQFARGVEKCRPSCLYRRVRSHSSLKDCVVTAVCCPYNLIVHGSSVKVSKNVAR